MYVRIDLRYDAVVLANRSGETAAEEVWKLGILLIVGIVCLEVGFHIAKIVLGSAVVALLSVVGELQDSDRGQNTNDGDYNYDFNEGESPTV